MLRGHSTFKQLKAQYENRIEYHKKGNEKSISPEELALVKKEIKVWTRNKRRKQNLVLVASITLLFGAMYIAYYVNQPDYVSRKAVHSLYEQRHQNQIHEQVKFYTDDAQFMMTQEKYHNANYQYNKALEQAPNNTMANVGLVFSLTKLCVSEERRCEEIEAVFGESYKLVNDKELYLDELFKLSLSADAKSKNVLQDLIESVRQ
jgi:hypothetical protein